MATFDYNSYFTSKGTSVQNDAESIRTAAEALLATPSGSVLTSNSSYRDWADTALKALKESDGKYFGYSAYDWITGRAQPTKAASVWSGYGTSYNDEKARLDNEAQNIANIMDFSNVSPEEQARITEVNRSRIDAFNNKLTTFNSMYSPFGFAIYEAPKMQNINGYIERLDSSGNVVTAMLPGANIQDQPKEPQVEAVNSTVSSSPVTDAFQPTEYSTNAQLSDLQKTVMGTDPSLKANDAFINGVFKAFHDRDATAAELTAYRNKAVGDVRNEVIGGAQVAGLPTVKPGTVDVQTGIMTPAQATEQGLQRVLRPDQLSAFKEDQLIRDNMGGVYLKPGAVTDAQTAAVAAGKSGTEIVGRTSAPSQTADASLVERGAASPGTGSLIEYLSSQNTNPTEVMETVAGSSVDVITRSIAALDAQLASLSAARSAAQGNINAIAGKITDLSFNQTREKDLARVSEEQGLVKRRERLNEVLSQIESEKAKLNLGLIKENNKLAPLSIIGSRQITLKEQAMATIGMLSAVAQIYQDDLDFAKEMVNVTMSAINSDRQDQLNALEFLTGLAQDEIIELREDERAVIKSRTEIITEAMKDAQKNAESVFDLIRDNPEAAVAAKVSLTDSPALALSKMAPYMAELAAMERETENSTSTGGLTANQRLDAAQRLMTADKSLTLEEALSQVDSALGSGSAAGEASAGWDSWVSTIGNGEFSQDFDTPASYFADGRTTHSGYDITGPLGSPITAPISGTVVKVVTDQSDAKSGYGNEVQIKDADGNIWRFGHLQGTDLKVGQSIDSGSLIGQMGSTGYSTGSHLHLEVRDAGGTLIDPKASLTGGGGDQMVSYSTFLEALGEEMQMSVDPQSDFAKNLYNEYTSSFGGSTTSSSDKSTPSASSDSESSDLKSVLSQYGID